MRCLQTYTEKYDGAGRLSVLPPLQTHYGVKVEAWSQRSSLCFCAKVSEERFAKVSWNTPRPHTTCRHFSFTHTSNCLAFCALSILPPSIRLFKTMSSIFHPATVFLFCLSCTRNLTKPPLFWGGKRKVFPGGTAPGPPPFYKHHTSTHTSYATENPTYNV